MKKTQRHNMMHVDCSKCNKIWLLIPEPATNVGLDVEIRGHQSINSSTD